MPIVPIRLVPGELADNVKWNNHADAIEEIQDAALISAWVTATLNSGWAVEPTHNQALQTRGTSTAAFLTGVIYATANKAANSVICNVPVAVRPSQRFFGIMHQDIASVPTPVRFDVLSNGNVVIVLPLSAGDHFILSTTWPLG